MKKKILSLVLVVAMLASMLVFAPSAGATETQATLAFGKAVGSAGDTVAVDFTVTTAALAGVQFLLDYDESKLTFEGIDWTTTVDGIPADLSGEKENYGVFFDNGTCDKVLSWATGIGVGAIDLSAGVVLATLRFTINADAPVGDAYVNFIPSGGISNKVNYGSASYTSEQIEFVNGAVTVLPEGYVSAAPSNPADFDIEDGVLYEYFPTSGGTVMIPSDVTVIESMAFNTKTIDTIIVPATVEEILANAFYRFARYTEVHIYVLGSQTTIDSTAFVSGNRYGKIYIHAAEGSTAAAVPTSEYIEFVPTSLCTLNVDGASYFVPVNTEIAAPGVATTDDGKVVVGWNDGTKTYAPGAAMTLTEDTELNPVTIDAIQMNTEVGFMLTDKITTSRMRYTTNMKIADYNTLASLGTVTLGTIITPAKYVSMAGGLTKEALTQLAIDNVDKIGALKDGKTGAGLTYIDVPATAANPFGKTADIYTFAGSLAGFKAENINLAYAAAFYATVELADGSSFTIYSAFDFGANRAVGATVEAAKAKAETKELKEAYDALIEMINANTSTAN